MASFLTTRKHVQKHEVHEAAPQLKHMGKSEYARMDMHTLGGWEGNEHYTKNGESNKKESQPEGDIY